MIPAEDQERKKQIAIGGGILFTLTVLICAALTGWRYIPGLLGEWIGTMIGALTTPFILETSFVILGFILVISINTWRRHRDGDELVYLESISGPDLPSDLPDQAKWAVYKHAPLAGETPDPLVRVEGALAIGDFESAAETLGSLAEIELHQPEMLKLRIRLARESGKEDLALKLERDLASAPSDVA
jgi:hypothetical protein